MDPSQPRSDTVEVVVLVGSSAEAGSWCGWGHAVAVAVCESKPCNVGPKSCLRNVAQRGENESHY